MNTIKRFAAAGIATLAILVAITVGTSADESEEGPQWARFNPEHHAAVQETIINNDYEAWAALVAESKHGEKMLEVINADNFGRFVEMHELRTQAHAIAEELGLPKHGKRMGHRFHKWRQNQQ